VRRYQLTLAYDGTEFRGWQRQRTEIGRTVQGVLEDALTPLGEGQRVAVTAAGRTDAGVHALGQVVSFDLRRQMGGAELRKALNSLLPGDVRVLEATPAPDGFHARRSATSKLYRYVLDCGGEPLPQRRRLAGWVPRPLDEDAVRSAARLYMGRHDFASLASAGGSVKTTVREVTRSEVTFDELGLTYEVEADGFLRKMVRSMVGGLIAVGVGKLAPRELATAFEARDRRAWPPPAPACGLTLVRVDYPLGRSAVLP
jgi:tRNA pseudouridine38-40 synthase